MNPQHADNAVGWDIAAAKYERDEPQDIAVLREGRVVQKPEEQAALGDLSWCARAIHLQCAAGTDTLSLLNLGARRVIGIDISERMIASARRKSAELGSSAEWYCCDVFDVPADLDGSADLVHTGQGALPWMSDMDQWASVAVRLLATGGLLHVFEGHPLDWVWDSDETTYEFHPSQGACFSREAGSAEVWPMPFVERAGATTTMHEFHHTLGDVVTAVARAGLRIELLQEHPAQFWGLFNQMPPETLGRLPHTFTLLARRP